jgi:hypothetical protein
MGKTYKFTDSECVAWASKPNENPVTHFPIDPAKPFGVARMLRAQCVAKKITIKKEKLAKVAKVTKSKDMKDLRHLSVPKVAKVTKSKKSKESKDMKDLNGPNVGTFTKVTKSKESKELNGSKVVAPKAIIPVQPTNNPLFVDFLRQHNMETCQIVSLMKFDTTNGLTKYFKTKYNMTQPASEHVKIRLTLNPKGGQLVLIQGDEQLPLLKSIWPSKLINHFVNFHKIQGIQSFDLRSMPQQDLATLSEILAKRF